MDTSKPTSGAPASPGSTNQHELPPGFSFAKSDTERVVIASSHYKGREYVDFRTWFRDGEGVWHPTRKGVTFALESLEEAEEGLRKIRRPKKGRAAA